MFGRKAHYNHLLHLCKIKMLKKLNTEISQETSSNSRIISVILYGYMSANSSIFNLGEKTNTF